MWHRKDPDSLCASSGELWKVTELRARRPAMGPLRAPGTVAEAVGGQPGQGMKEDIVKIQIICNTRESQMEPR